MRSDFVKAKVAFGELTLGEVCEIVWHRCTHITVMEDDIEKGTYSNLSKDEQGLYLYLEPDGQDPDYSFDAKVKVKVRNDCVSFKLRGCEVTLQFLESRPINLGSLLPRK